MKKVMDIMDMSIVVVAVLVVMSMEEVVMSIFGERFLFLRDSMIGWLRSMKLRLY